MKTLIFFFTGFSSALLIGLSTLEAMPCVDIDEYGNCINIQYERPQGEQKTEDTENLEEKDLDPTDKDQKHLESTVVEPVNQGE